MDDRVLHALHASAFLVEEVPVRRAALAECQAAASAVVFPNEDGVEGVPTTVAEFRAVLP